MVNANWPEIVEHVRENHNGVFAVRLYLGHDGHNACYFHDYDKIVARGESGVSMQEAVERCLELFLQAGNSLRLAHGKLTMADRNTEV